MSKFSNAVLAGFLSAALFAVPAMAQKDGGGVQVGGGKAAGGGGGGKAVSGGGGGMKSSGGGGGGNRVHSNTTRSPGTVRSTPRSSGVVIQQNRTVIRDRNVGGSRHVERRGHHRGTRYLWGGLPFYFYDGYYHGDCGWLRRRAEATGSRYWWIRYRQCREDD
jgi:hypothetical protein